MPVSYTHLDVYKRQRLKRKFLYFLVRLLVVQTEGRTIYDEPAQPFRHAVIHILKKYGNLHLLVCVQDVYKRQARQHQGQIG